MLICRLCGSTRTKKYSSYQLKCLDCKVVFLERVKDPIDLYSENYYNKDYTLGVFDSSDCRERYEQLKEISKRVKGSVLEIGCGMGDFVGLINGTGIDISEFAIERARKRYTNRFILGDFMALKEKFDTVVMIDVLEHLLNPCEAIKEIRSISKKLVLKVPTYVNSLYFKLSKCLKPIIRATFKDKAGLLLKESENPYHIFEFNKRSLEYVLKPYRKVKYTPYMPTPSGLRIPRLLKSMPFSYIIEAE